MRLTPRPYSNKLFFCFGAQVAGKRPTFFLWAFVGVAALLLLWFSLHSAEADWSWMVKRIIRSVMTSIL